MPAASLASSSAQPASQAFEVRPFTEKVGAEIVGLDLSRPLNDADFARLHQAHLDHHVVVFRDQQITPQQQIDFSFYASGCCRSMCSSSFCWPTTRKS